MVAAKWWLPALAACIALVLGLTVFRSVDIAAQREFTGYLLNVGAVLFAVLGVWIAVLNPASLLDRTPADSLTEREKLALDLLRPWRYATFVFGATIVLYFAQLIIPEGWAGTVANVLSGTVVTGLFLLVLNALFGTLLPVARIGYRERERQDRRRYRDR